MFRINTFRTRITILNSFQSSIFYTRQVSTTRIAFRFMRYYGNWMSGVDTTIPHIPLMLNSHKHILAPQRVYILSALLHQTLPYIDRSVIFPVWQFSKVYYMYSSCTCTTQYYAENAQIYAARTNHRTITKHPLYRLLAKQYNNQPHTNAPCVHFSRFTTRYMYMRSCAVSQRAF